MAQQQADALALVAETALDQGMDPGTPGERYQVVVHVDAPALADPDRGLDAIVIGEYERAFYASQYASMAPLFEHYGIQLWMPEVGGRSTGTPATVTTPAVGASNPPMMLSKVDLPQPDGPSRQTNSPLRISSETSSSASTLCAASRPMKFIDT